MLVVWLLVACGYSESKFTTDYDAAYCDWAVSCGYFAAASDCLADTAPAPTGCTYDPRAAKACVDGVKKMSCPASGAFPAFPAACGSVHTGCGGDTGGSDTGA